MKTILLGYSGHGIVLAEAAIESGLNLFAYCDLEKKDNNPFDLKYLGHENQIESKFFNGKYQFIIGIGNNEIRDKIFKLIISKSLSIAKVIHPDASVSTNSLIGPGVFISKKACINSMGKIGENSIINTAAIIEHDCTIESGVHIGPGSVVLGNVKVGKQSFIGANSTIREGVVIGRNVIIGAGSLVLEDVPDNSLCYGSPIKVIK